ncbi:MAG: (2Fe-2S) ferredoxin domain-containing protein [Planctomycetia bacterium]|nr:(2Fe-2S) ferredoxin domain-containing protein [Planctomycetia bacterium]
MKGLKFFLTKKAKVLKWISVEGGILLRMVEKEKRKKIFMCGMPKIEICIGSSCFSRGNAKNVEIVEKYLEEHGLQDDVDVELRGTLCSGQCTDGPIVTVNGKIYRQVDRGMILEILKDIFVSEVQ